MQQLCPLQFQLSCSWAPLSDLVQIYILSHSCLKSFWIWFSSFSNNNRIWDVFQDVKVVINESLQEINLFLECGNNLYIFRKTNKDVCNWRQWGHSYSYALDLFWRRLAKFHSIYICYYFDYLHQGWDFNLCGPAFLERQPKAILKPNVFICRFSSVHFGNWVEPSSTL